MKNSIYTLIALLVVFGSIPVSAQTSSTNYLMAQPIPDRTVYYSVSAAGDAKPLYWGLDTAWPDEANIRRGVAFMGVDQVDLVRTSFQPTHPLINGDLQPEQIDWINKRIGLIDLTGPNTRLALNSDHPSVDAWYAGNAARWAQLMDVTARRFQEAGRTIVTISPFNEPDLGWGQGTIQDFYNIAGELRKNPRFDNIRISGGNTLNCDQALPWYNTLRDRLDEGNTHQLAGSFDNFAGFYQTVRANGHHATGDELHNVMEAMVGVEYGMQTGIWWGTAELARGEFVKASDGVRLGYAEHRPNWTAASVYRGPTGKIQAFAGTSERQAVTTTYRFVSQEGDVYYDGHGPQREYTLVLPGGTGYQTGQTNAERVVNITWGDDIQPVIAGTYLLVNRSNGQVLEVAGASASAGAALQVGTSTAAAHQQWRVTPVEARVGGDFSYFTITAAHSGKAPDILNWSLENGGRIIVWDDVKSVNQQWYLDYAEDGWFYIRSRYSAKCLDVSATDGVGIVQWDKKAGASQQWRFLRADAPVEFVAPAAPANLVAQAQPLSIRLDWTASPEADVAGYTVFRATAAGGHYRTVAQQVTGTSFVDHTAIPGTTYFYTLKAVDKSMNRSAYSGETSAQATGAHDLVTHLHFDGNTTDSSRNLNHGAAYGSVAYANGKVGANALMLDGTNFIQLPPNLADHAELTIATWVYWNGGNDDQRIFDFGSGESAYLYASPGTSSGQMQFVVRQGGSQQTLSAPRLQKFKWTHVAVTWGEAGATLYINGRKSAASTAVTIRPKDLKAILNYIGRGQYAAVPLLNGNIDDFRVFNHVLTPGAIAQLAGVDPPVDVPTDVNGADLHNSHGITLWPMPATRVVHLGKLRENAREITAVTVNDLNGRTIIRQDAADQAELDVSALPPGMYTLHLSRGADTVVKKLLIQR